MLQPRPQTLWTRFERPGAEQVSRRGQFPSGLHFAVADPSVRLAAVDDDAAEVDRPQPSALENPEQRLQAHRRLLLPIVYQTAIPQQTYRVLTPDSSDPPGVAGAFLVRGGEIRVVHEDGGEAGLQLAGGTGGSGGAWHGGKMAPRPRG
jgi:hypothetical protein